MAKQRYEWGPILDEGRTIVESYDTGVTLRQLFYRLVAGHHLPNVQSYYPATLHDDGAGTPRRDVPRPARPDQPHRAVPRRSPAPTTLAATSGTCTGGTAPRARSGRSVLVGVEKAGISAQLDAWFTDPLGIPHGLGGFTSQTLCDEVAHDIVRQGRPAVLLYAGDFDPSGVVMDIDFANRVGVFDKVIRVALNEEQVDKSTDCSRTRPGSEGEGRTGHSSRRVRGRLRGAHADRGRCAPARDAPGPVSGGARRGVGRQRPPGRTRAEETDEPTSSFDATCR